MKEEKLKFKIGDWASQEGSTGQVIEKIGFIFIEDYQTKKHTFIRKGVKKLNIQEVSDYLKSIT